MKRWADGGKKYIYLYFKSAKAIVIVPDAAIPSSMEPRVAQGIKVLGYIFSLMALNWLQEEASGEAQADGWSEI